MSVIKLHSVQIMLFEGCWHSYKISCSYCRSFMWFFGGKVRKDV